ATYYAVGSTWSFTAVPSSAVWINGLVYEIQTQGIDKAFGAAAGNTEVPGAARSFTYDVALPTATISTLNSGTTYSAVLASGTVSDPAPGVIDYVQLLIKDHGTPTLPNDPPGYWDGTTWKFTGVFTTRAVIAGGDWSVVNLPNFEDRHFYTMVSSAVDKAGNPQSQFFFAVNNSSVSFYADKAAPAITFNTPPSGDYYTKSMANVTGVVIDPNIVLDPNMTVSAGVSGGANVLVQVKYFEGGTTYYWDGSNNFNTPGGGCPSCTEVLAWESPLGYAIKGPSSGSWTYSNGGIAVKWLPAKNYTIAARGRDNAYPAQNISSSFTLANVVYDLSWPTATVTGPSNLTPAKAVALTSGTVLDNFDGVASVALVISYVQAGTSYYWNGSTFAAGAYQSV
ncbi:MAG: hypothetical protein AAB412_00340, partial [Elusimicrobiota bacterium]